MSPHLPAVSGVSGGYVDLIHVKDQGLGGRGLAQSIKGGGKGRAMHVNHYYPGGKGVTSSLRWVERGGQYMTKIMA